MKTAKIQLAPVEEVIEDLKGHEEAPEPDIHGVAEARCPPGMTDPQKPSEKEVTEHERTHVPYRSWCRICVEAEAREDAHRRDAADRDGEQRMPTIAFDYDH